MFINEDLFNDEDFKISLKKLEIEEQNKKLFKLKSFFESKKNLNNEDKDNLLKIVKTIKSNELELLSLNLPNNNSNLEKSNHILNEFLLEKDLLINEEKQTSSNLSSFNKVNFNKNRKNVLFDYWDK